MNLENFLKRLARLADRAPQAGLPDRTPFGFTTRVLARLREAEPENPWARLAVRAVPVGAAAALLSLVLAHREPAFVPEPEATGLAQHIVRNTLEQ